MSERDARQRLFFALLPDEGTGEHLQALSQELRGHARAPGRATPLANLHLTLAFVGLADARQRDCLCQQASDLQLGAIDVALDELGFWPRGGIAYAGCSAPLAARNDRLMAAFACVGALLNGCGIPREARTPVPHVTLLRGARGVDLPRLAAPIRWLADEFCLMSSEPHAGGTRYRKLAAWPMQVASHN